MEEAFVENVRVASAILLHTQICHLVNLNLLEALHCLNLLSERADVRDCLLEYPVQRVVSEAHRYPSVLRIILDFIDV